MIKPLGQQILTVFLMVSLPALSGCDSTHSRLRTFFHPEESPQGFEGDTGITLQIQPHSDLEIRLDGEVVGAESPYSARFLPAGPHQFLVKAAGFMPLSIALDLQKGRHLTIPLALRPITSVQPEELISNHLSFGPDLPQQIKPAKIKIGNSFGARPVLDGQPTDSVTTLTRTWGELALADIVLTYRFDKFGHLEVVLPGHRATWYASGKEVEPGTAHRVEASGLKLSEQKPGGPPRSLSLSRP